MSKDSANFKLFSFQGAVKTLHLTWFAFFLTFFLWFNHAPLEKVISSALGLTKEEWKTLLILNVALTIPARIVVGILVDKYGPKITFATLLVFGSIPCFMFAMADNYAQLALARFLLGGVGAGFVIGIRLISEWFPARQVGVAEGIYGGWGNFGSSVAAMSLPFIASLFGGEDGWRYAVATTGFVALAYAFVFYNSVRDTPKGSTYFKPKKSGAMEVSSRSDLWMYIALTVPMYVALGVLAWKLSPAGVKLLSEQATWIIYASLLALFLVNVHKIFDINKENFKQPVADIHKYKFKQVALLSLTYMVTFGSELAVISMLPSFYQDTFNLSVFWGSFIAGAVFASFNLFARPIGGYMSDKMGRKLSLSILLAGTAVGYFLMSQVTAQWPIVFAILATMLASLFVHAGNGAVYAVVPLIRRRMTGQIAGMAGAYGNVGAVIFLTVNAFVQVETFFLTLTIFAVVMFGLIQLLDEPKGHIVEVLPDGTVQMIEVE